jgi:hypothetical protein
MLSSCMNAPRTTMPANNAFEWTVSHPGFVNQPRPATQRGR